ncbi:hypothetical protein [Actinoplanes sp. NPDC089786]
MIAGVVQFLHGGLVDMIVVGPTVIAALSSATASAGGLAAATPV